MSPWIPAWGSQFWSARGGRPCCRPCFSSSGRRAAAGVCWRRSARATDAAMFHQALKGFSGLGTLAVGLLTASGLVNTTFTVGMANLRLAPDTAYGQLLIVKLVLFGLMLVLAASNRFALTPALGRSLQTVDARMASLGRLKRSVILESVVGAALVAVVAILGIQPPPGSGF